MASPLRHLWPPDWRPDVRTLGLLIAGFFAYLAVIDLQAWNLQLDAAFGRPPAGLPPGYPFLYPTSARVFGGAAFAFGLANIVVACGGVAIMAGVRGGRATAAFGLAVGIGSLLATLATAEHGGRYGSLGGVIAGIVGEVLLLQLVTGWVPHWPVTDSDMESSDPSDDEEPYA